MVDGLPFDRSDEFEKSIQDRGFSDEAIGFLMLCFQAANGTAPPGIAGKFVAKPDPVYVMASQIGQCAVAHYCGVGSDRSLRRMTDQLSQCGLLVKRTTRTPAGRQTAYVVLLQKLFQMPVVGNDNPIDSICDILQAGGVDALCGTASQSMVVRQETNAAFAEHLQERLTMTENHPEVKLSSISDDHVRLIAGFAVGRSDPMSPRERVELFAGYWRDAKIREGNLISDDCVNLLALFLHWGRNKIKQTSSQNPRGRCVATWWKNRHTMPLTNTIRPQEVAEARRMLESKRKPAEPDSESTIRKSVSCNSEAALAKYHASRPSVSVAVSVTESRDATGTQVPSLGEISRRRLSDRFTQTAGYRMSKGIESE